jgi:hypothetical protein
LFVFLNMIPAFQKNTVIILLKWLS